MVVFLDQKAVVMLKTDIEFQTKQVEKVISDHGFDWKGIDYSIHAILVLKAMYDGVEDPYKWATDQCDAMNKSISGS